MKRVVIAGGTGLIGSHLSRMLSAEGYEVVHLTRKIREGGSYKSFRWDPDQGYCDADAFRDGDAIINLAGANLGARPWTKARRRDIIKSRTVTAELLFRSTAGHGIRPLVYVTASGVNYYGSSSTGNIYEENDPPGDDFLGETCRLWEAAADPFEAAGTRVVKLRTAVVLAPAGSALSKMTFPARAGLIVRFGPGNQYFPWIHIDDLCRIYLKAVSDSAMNGPYNASAPDHQTHDMLMAGVAKQKRLPILLPHLPAWLLRALMGEMSVILTAGNMISPERIISSGFAFRYPELAPALRDCL
ncbi:MAG: TIGR01777 family oxidoreductase [Bacteroidales bacterium]|nr:TIGR01777 family oxidoreductase [Bacteroidales bacterium]